MVKDLENRREERDIVLLYCCAKENDFAYRTDFDKASPVIGMKNVYLATATQGVLTADIVRREIPDFLDRDYYISGPHGMVVNYKKLLKIMGVSSAKIHTDYFPGF
jgi:ferredoxin-NADP reductase